MNAKLRRMLGVAWVCASVAVAAATEPAYLAGLPDVDGVRSNFQGTDRFDSAARQYAALVVLINSLRDLSDGRILRNAPTPGEAARQRSYVLALKDIEREQAQATDPACAGADCPKARLNRLQLRYSLDGAFRKEVFERLTTQEWRERYLKDWHELVAQHGAAPTQSPRQSANLSLPEYRPPPTAAEAAANPRLSVFGLGLDQPFTLPRCPMGSGPDKSGEQFIAMLSQSDRFCHLPMTDIIATMLGAEPGSVAIQLPRARCPNWVGCQMYAQVSTGRLRSVTLTVKNQEEATQALLGKYGEPTRRIPMHWVNQAGMDIKHVDLEWSLDDVYVFYNTMTNLSGVGRVTVKGPSRTRQERQQGEQKKANDLKF